MALWKTKINASDRAAKRAIFLDRDGVVIAERHYLSDPEQVKILPGVVEAMIRAHDAGFLLVGVSNQSGIGRGRFSVSDFESVMTRLDELLEQGGISFDAFLYCPHAPEENCKCRKPQPGLLQEASCHVNYSPNGSWVVGDKLCDVNLGRNLGLGGILVLTGHGLNQADDVAKTWPDDPMVKIVADLPAAIDFILNNDRGQML